MNFNDLCCICCGDRQAFWDKLARQLQRYRYCANGDCTEDATHNLPGHGTEGMSPDQFAMMGFMVLPMLFVMYGVMQRMNRTRQITQGGKPSGPEHGRRDDEGPPTPPVD